MAKLKYGIVGLGIGQTHASALKNVEEAELYAVCDVVEPVLQKFADEHNVSHRFTDFDAFLRSEVEAVSICTPHYLHAPQVIAALQAGKHVLCEKPMAIKVSEADRMIAAAKRTGRKLGLCFQYRTTPRMKALRAIIAELGELSRGLYLAGHLRTQAYYDSGKWRGTWWGEGGGVLINQGIHDLDMLCWLMGVMPVRCTALTCTFAHSIEVEDLASAIFELPGGGQVLFQTSTVNHPSFSRIEFSGDRGAVTADGGIKVAKLQQSVKEFIRTCPEAWGRAEKVEWQDVQPTQEPSGHDVVVRDFVEAVLNDRDPLVPAEDGIKSLELMNAIVLSSFTGKTVEIPVDRKAYDDLLAQLRS